MRRQNVADLTQDPAQKENSVSAPVIGILAGMGPRSTGPFIDLVVTECQRQYNARHDVDFPKMLICSQPTPFYEDRPIDHQALEAAITDGLQHLEQAGADFLVIACNTAHVYFSSLERSVGVPLLNIVELAVAAIPSHSRSVALVAARPTVESSIFQNHLRQCGYHDAEIDWQAEVDDLLGAIRETAPPEVLGQLWSKIIQRVQAGGADTILVACLDLSGIIAHASTQIPIIDAAQSLAHETVSQWLQRKKGGTSSGGTKGESDTLIDR